VCAGLASLASPSLFAFLGAGAHCQHFFVSCQSDAKCRYNDGGIGLISMTNAEVYPIKVQNAPVLLQGTLSPRIKLLAERVVEATDRAGA
jgi:hypothetical protein